MRVVFRRRIGNRETKVGKQMKSCCRPYPCRAAFEAAPLYICCAKQRNTAQAMRSASTPAARRAPLSLRQTYRAWRQEDSAFVHHAENRSAARGVDPGVENPRVRVQVQRLLHNNVEMETSDPVARRAVCPCPTDSMDNNVSCVKQEGCSIVVHVNRRPPARKVRAPCAKHVTSKYQRTVMRLRSGNTLSNKAGMLCALLFKMQSTKRNR